MIWKLIALFEYFIIGIILIGSPKEKGVSNLVMALFWVILIPIGMWLDSKNKL